MTPTSSMSEPRPTADESPGSAAAAGSETIDATALWSRALESLRTTASRAVFDAWYRPIRVVGADRSTLRLAVADRQIHDLLVGQHLPLIRSTLAAIARRPLQVELRVDAGNGGLDGIQHVASAGAAARSSIAMPAAQAELPLAIETPVSGPAWSDQLIPMLSFDAFVEGSCNQLAAGVSRAVAASPGTTYNPLFLHGGVGVGKTHLLHAIGLEARARRPDLRVLYVQAASFIDDVIAAMRHSKRKPQLMSDLRRRYRNVDLLLIDDIQFMRSKEKTEEEFFHTFNALHQASKQIVLTSDRHPVELQGFSDRLSSRFSWGLVAEVTPPDRDTRIAILLRKIREYDMAVPLDVVHYLADHLRNNVRELESGLKKLHAHSRIGGRRIDLTMTRQVMGPLVAVTGARMTIDAIQRATAQHFGLKITDLKGGRRHRVVVRPRMVAMYLCRELLGASYPEIGRAFGGRDHATAINAHRRIKGLVRDDEAVRTATAAIAATLGR